MFQEGGFPRWLASWVLFAKKSVVAREFSLEFDTSLAIAMLGLRTCALPMRLPNPSPVLDKLLAPIGPEILSSLGKAPMAFPDSSSVLDKFQSANTAGKRNSRTSTGSPPVRTILLVLFFLFFGP